MNKISTKSIIVAVFVIAFLFVTFFVFATYKNMKQTQIQNIKAQNSLQVLLSIGELLSDLEDLETQQRGYTFSNKELFTIPYNQSLTTFKKNTFKISLLLIQNPKSTKEINELKQLIVDKIDYSAYTVAMYDSSGVDPVVTIIKKGKGKLLSDNIRSIAAKLVKEENASLEQSNVYLIDLAERTSLRFFILASVFIFILAFFFLLIKTNLKNKQIASDKLSYQASLIDTISDAIFSTDDQFNIQSWNKYATLYYGFSKNEAIGKNLTSLLTIHLSDAEIEKSFLNLQRDGHYRSEYLVTKNDGTDVFIQAGISSIVNKNGLITGYVAVHRDITERKQLEVRLKLFNQQLAEQVRIKTAELSEIFERITDGFIALDKDWNYTYVNERICQLMGKKEQAFIGENIWTAFPPLQNELYFYEIYQKAMAEQRYYFLELYYSPLNIWIENHIYPSPSGISIYFRDITQRKEAEEKAIKAGELSDKIIDSLPGIFFMYQKSQLKLYRWNKKLEAIIGNSTNEVAQKNIDEFIVENDRNFLIRKIEDTFSFGQNEMETMILTKSGEKIPFFFTAMAIEIEGKSFIIGNGIDISERKAAEYQSKKNFIKIKLLASFTEAISQAAALDQIYKISLDALVKSTSEAKVAISLFDENSKLALKKSHAFSDKLSHAFQQFSPWPINKKDAKSLLIINIHQEPLLQKVLPLLIEEDIDSVCFIPLLYQSQLLGHFTLLFKYSFIFTDEEQQLVETIARGVAFAINEKYSELALIASTQKYKLLFYNNPMPMWMLSYPERNFIDVNEAALNHYGFTRDEFLQMNVANLRPDEDVDGFVKLTTNLNSNYSYKGIWRHKKKNGVIIKVEIIAHNIFYEGKNVRLILANDIDEKIKSEEKLQESYRQIRQLANHLQNIREEERTTIAREIHDELGQQLTGLKMYVSSLQKKVASQDVSIKNNFSNTMELIEDTIKSVRKISTDLRPSMLDDLGLLAAMEWQNSEFEKRSGIISCFINRTSNKQIPQAYKTGLFRIFQESLTNVARHSDAENVVSYLTMDDEYLTLSITDDGKGFEINEIGSKKTLGLFGMKERSMEMGGDYEIKSEPGIGTTVLVTIPL